MINIKENERLNVMNHSCAHLMAHAVKNLYPQAMFWVGPVITDGFYYDIDLSGDAIREEDLPKIEAEMKKLSKDGKRIVRVEVSKVEALDMFKDDKYKIDLISQMNEDDTIISVYKQGDWMDLCRGPHVESLKELKNFKLLKVSGAYWKGDSDNEMLQRIYGVCFESKEELDEHLRLIEEAKKRDHKKLGKELELFMISEYGPGFPFWLPNGMTLRHLLENFWWKEHVKEGYQFIQTPIMLSQELWQISGHWENYRENMYTSTLDERTFAIKPMNCPGGLLVYKNSLHSYKDLPLRVGELGLVHRHEASGALNGLFRVRNFTQDDAHIFMTEDQIESEVVRLINFIDRIYKVFGLTYSIELSTRPEKKYIGEIEVWDRSEAALEKACHSAGKACKINPGDGAFYGPKLDFHIRDSLGRVWQCGTIQLDMNLPERFDLTYIAPDGTKKRPILLHRVIYGSVERFIGILIEHYGGAFPMWLAPVQAVIVPVNPDLHNEASYALAKRLEELEIRVKVDDRNEKLGYRIREAQITKIPVQLVLGDGEVANNSINIRRYGQQNSETLPVDEFIAKLLLEIGEKS
ncbi:MAG: threonine--tRNA ligase [Erysipelotrichaceae bacterium]|nr:threonine--tRNA ligase [Erysipelotrichaceae bacterium]